MNYGYPGISPGKLETIPSCPPSIIITWPVTWPETAADEITTICGAISAGTAIFFSGTLVYEAGVLSAPGLERQIEHRTLRWTGK